MGPLGVRLKTVRELVKFFLFYVPVGLVENALFGWGDARLGLTNEFVDRLLAQVLQFGVPALTVALLLAIGLVVADLRVSNKYATAVQAIDARLVSGASWLDSLFPPKLIPIKAAAQILYDELHGTRIVAFVERNFGGNLDRVLSVMAAYVWQSSAPVFGRRPGTLGLRSLDKEIMKTGRIHAEAGEFRKHGQHQAEYEALAVRLRDIGKIVREAKRWDEGFTPDGG